MRKNWCFWTVVLERLLRVPWTARRSNQSILKDISPGCSSEGLMLKLKLQYFGHLMRKANSLEKTLMLGETEAGGAGWMASPTQWTWVWVNSGRQWKKSGMLQSTGSQRLGHLVIEQQQHGSKCITYIINSYQEKQLNWVNLIFISKWINFENNIDHKTGFKKIFLSW